MTYTLDNGLLTNPETNPPTCAGYIFNFSGRGAFAPNGRVKINGQEEELTQSQIDANLATIRRGEKTQRQPVPPKGRKGARLARPGR